MRGDRAAFAKNSQNGLSNYGWHTSNTSRNTLIRLAYDNITGSNITNPYRYDADCVFVSISSPNASYSLVLPNLVVNVTPTRTTASPSPSQTGTGIATGNGASGMTSKKSVGRRIEMESGGWVAWGALLLAGLL
jgi:cholinesterase